MQVYGAVRLLCNTPGMANENESECTLEKWERRPKKMKATIPLSPMLGTEVVHFPELKSL